MTVSPDRKLVLSPERETQIIFNYAKLPKFLPITISIRITILIRVNS